MTAQIHTRNIPSDFDTEIVLAAVAKRTDPAFIPRPGFLQCPRDKRFWPADHFKPNHASFLPSMVQARCRDCRRGASRALRAEAIRTGICEARSCSAPIVDRFQCAHHLTLSDETGARRRAAKLAAK